jgi:hypothetical protein
MPLFRQGAELSAVFQLAWPFQVVALEGRELRSHTCKGKFVPQIPSEPQFETVERLACELRAIDKWDVGYWLKRHQENYERAAYSSRKKRRGEIMRALRQPHALIVGLRGEPGTDNPW